MRKKTGVQIESSTGSMNTRINPINRNSEIDFALRMGNKSTRKVGFTASQGTIMISH